MGNRVLKWTYRVAVHPKFQEGDSLSANNQMGIQKFCLMAKRGAKWKKTAEFCDKTEMYKLGEFYVDLPDTHFGLDRP
ncbi:13029_t:CDS:2, partial [Gigaspora rosea]